jgi:hypothetical protein
METIIEEFRNIHESKEQPGPCRTAASAQVVDKTTAARVALEEVERFIAAISEQVRESPRPFPSSTRSPTRSTCLAQREHEGRAGRRARKGFAVVAVNRQARRTDAHGQQ